MLGLMQYHEMTVDEFLAHAERWHGATEVISRRKDGVVERTDYATIASRARRISSALVSQGVRPGTRIATLASNTARHLECWYGIVGIGAVCHTVNPRMSGDQLAYIIDHAQDQLIFVEKQYLPLINDVRHRLNRLERVVVLDDPFESYSAAHGGGTDGLDAFLSRGGQECTWGGFDEQLACGLCYTSGTTGDPKGVLYSHRSNYLHTLIALQPDMLGLSVSDVVMPIVPMFHANAWGIVYATPAVGAKLVLPGSRLDPASLLELMESEHVTFAAAVPTVWLALLDYLRTNSLRPSTLKRIVVGGSAVPLRLIDEFEQRYGIEVGHFWGMTEVSPIGSASRRWPKLAALPVEHQMALRLKQGRCPIGVEMEITDDIGRPVPHDGRTYGHLVVRGRTVAAAYFRRPEQAILDEDGYFDTGDIATIDEHGYMQITDRAKDLIKSGGEWISSMAIENAAASCFKVELAAVIPKPHPEWGERPLLIVQLRPQQHATQAEILEHLQGKLPRWWLPDEVLVIERMPLGATGKIDKKTLRGWLASSDRSDINCE